MNKKIGIISPSMPLKSPDETAAAVRYLEESGIVCEFFTETSKIDGLNAAQASDADLLMASRGGFDSIELLPQIDFNQMKKQLCGFSDITVLLNALLSQTGQVQFLGPNLKSLNVDVDGYSLGNFIKTVWQDEEVRYLPSLRYVDPHTDKKREKSNSGPVVVTEGAAEGYLVGGNLCSQIMLCGTKYYPVYDNMLIVAEEDDLCGEHSLDMFLRNLRALFEYNFAKNIKGLIIGRFMDNSKVDIQCLMQKLREFEPLGKIPVIAGFDTGHTLPQMTLPLGKKAVFDTSAPYVLRF